jgi:DNA-binding response OmpR family regulator
MRVLVVEDHEVLAEAIGTGLRREGMAVDVVLDGSAALDRLTPIFTKRIGPQSGQAYW